MNTDILNHIINDRRERIVMQTVNIKETAHQLIDKLPENVSWSELAYHIEVRASIERGIEDAEAGRTYTTEEVKRHLGLTK